MPKGGLEPPCPFEHNALNVACLPISPLRLEAYDTLSFEVCQYLSRVVIHYCGDACYNYSDFLNILESGSFYARSTEIRVKIVAGVRARYWTCFCDIRRWNRLVYMQIRYVQPMHDAY